LARQVGVASLGVDIAERPKEVKEKVKLVDWQGVTISTKDNASAIVSIVDKSTRFTILVLVGGIRAKEVSCDICNMFMSIIERVKTTTLDNRKKFSQQMLMDKERR
jgi:IS30 family transposase